MILPVRSGALKSAHLFLSAVAAASLLCWDPKRRRKETVLRTVKTAVIYLWDHITAKAGHPAWEDDNTHKRGLDDSGLVVPITVYLCLQVFYPYLWVLPPGLCVINLLCARCCRAFSFSVSLWQTLRALLPKGSLTFVVSAHNRREKGQTRYWQKKRIILTHKKRITVKLANFPQWIL